MHNKAMHWRQLNGIAVIWAIVMMLALGMPPAWAARTLEDWQALFPPGSDLSQIHPNNRFFLGMDAVNNREALGPSAKARQYLYALLKENAVDQQKLLLAALKQDLSSDPSNTSPVPAAHQDDFTNLLVFVHASQRHPSMAYWLESLAGAHSHFGAPAGRYPSAKRIWMLLRYLYLLTQPNSVGLVDRTSGLADLPELQSRGATWIIGRDQRKKMVMVSPVASMAQGKNTILAEDIGALASAYPVTKAPAIVVMASADHALVAAMEPTAFPLEVQAIVNKQIHSFGYVRPAPPIPQKIQRGPLRLDEKTDIRAWGHDVEKYVLDFLDRQKILIELDTTNRIGAPDAFINRGYPAAVEIKSFSAESLEFQAEKAAEQVVKRFADSQIPQEVIFRPTREEKLHEEKLTSFWERFSRQHPEVHLQVHILVDESELKPLHQHTQVPARLDHSVSSLLALYNRKWTYKDYARGKKHFPGRSTKEKRSSSEEYWMNRLAKRKKGN